MTANTANTTGNATGPAANSAANTAAAQLRRLLHVIPLLADGQDHPIARMAEIAGIEDGRQLLADLRALVERSNLPGAFVEGVQVWIDSGNVAVVSSHFKRPMRLTVAELSALELGLAVLRSERPPSEYAVLERALERLRSAMTDISENEAHEGLRSAAIEGPGSVERLTGIRRALAGRHKVRIMYHSGSAPDAQWRTICPYGLLFATGHWYVVAHCDASDALRFFRLERIEATEPTSESYVIPPDFALDSVAPGGRVLNGMPVMTMRVRYSAGVAAWIAEREGASPESDGTLTVEHPVHDLDWAVHHVLQYGPDAEVLAPVELRALIAERLDAVANAV